MVDLAVASRLNINKSKSVIYIARVSDEIENNILEVIAIPKGSLPFRYLGLPPSNKRLGIKNCLPIVEKVTARLNHWVTKKLSVAGQVHLVQRVIQSMHTYWCQVFLLPKAIIKMIEKKCNGFIWAGSSDSHSKPRIVWDKVCKPIVFRGSKLV